MNDGHSGQHLAREQQPAFDPAPLILTLRLDPEAEARFDRLRALHFPPERNFLAAHVTLFHHLPAERADAVRATLDATGRATAPFAVEVTGLRSLGRGTAFALHSPDLAALRADLAKTWAADLGPQDRQGFRPHVTVQNKVTPEQARALLRQLTVAFVPFSVQATGLSLWRYRGGPWDEAGTFSFQAV